MTSSAPPLVRPDPITMRWQSGLIIAGVVLYAGAGLAFHAGRAWLLPGWLWTVAWLVLMAGAATAYTASVRSPRLAAAGDYPQGLAADGPERRRVRRALREGTPLDPVDRDRALLRARLRTVGGGARAERALLGNAFLMTAVIGSTVDTPPQLDGATLLSGVALLAIWIAVATARWRRPRRRGSSALVDRLENHPVTATGSGAAALNLP